LAELVLAAMVFVAAVTVLDYTIASTPRHRRKPEL
jgi:hypothetical protein